MEKLNPFDPTLPGPQWVQHNLKAILESIESKKKPAARGTVADAPQLSELGVGVANILDAVQGGIYNISNSAFSTDWTNPHFIEVPSFSSNRLATFDFDHLSALVILCHDACIRVEVNPQSSKYVMLRFHRRHREGGMAKRHPTIEAHIDSIRERCARFSVGAADDAPDLKAQLAFALEDNERLRKEALLGLEDSMKLRALEIREGHMDVIVTSEIVPVMAASLARFYELEGGPNNVSIEMRVPDENGIPYELIIKPLVGKLPAVLASEFKTLLVESTTKLKALLDWMDQLEGEARAPADVFMAAWNALMKAQNYLDAKPALTSLKEVLEFAAAPESQLRLNADSNTPPQ